MIPFVVKQSAGFWLCFYFRDFASVLQCIKSNSKKFKIFVVNCVAAIQAGSSPSQWRHLGTAHNPTDKGPGKKPELFGLLHELVERPKIPLER